MAVTFLRVRASIVSGPGAWLRRGAWHRSHGLPTERARCLAPPRCLAPLPWRIHGLSRYDRDHGLTNAADGAAKYDTMGM